MRKSRNTDEPIVAMLRETDREPVAAVAKWHKVSEQAIYAWKKRFGTFHPDNIRRLTAQAGERAAEELVAERDLEIEVMKEIAEKMMSVPACREQVAVRETPWPVAAAGLHAEEGDAVGARLPIDQDGPRWAGVGTDGGAVGAVSALRYRRIRIFLGRDGHAMSPGRARRTVFLW